MRLALHHYSIFQTRELWLGERADPVVNKRRGQHLKEAQCGSGFLLSFTDLLQEERGRSTTLGHR